MSARDPRRSVEYWQRVSARWKVIALAALTALVLVATVAIVALVAETKAKTEAFDQVKKLQEDVLIEKISRLPMGGRWP
jgi:hypothetical protein